MVLCVVYRWQMSAAFYPLPLWTQFLMMMMTMTTTTMRTTWKSMHQVSSQNRLAHLILGRRLYDKPVPATQVFVKLGSVPLCAQSFIRRPLGPRVANKDGGVAHAPSRYVRLDVRQSVTLHYACAKTLPVTNWRQVEVSAPPVIGHVYIHFYAINNYNYIYHTSCLML